MLLQAQNVTFDHPLPAYHPPLPLPCTYFLTNVLSFSFAHLRFLAALAPKPCKIAGGHAKTRAAQQKDNDKDKNIDNDNDKYI